MAEYNDQLRELDGLTGLCNNEDDDRQGKIFDAVVILEDLIEQLTMLRAELEAECENAEINDNEWQFIIDIKRVFALCREAGIKIDPPIPPADHSDESKALEAKDEYIVKLCNRTQEIMRQFRDERDSALRSKEENFVREYNKIYEELESLKNH